MLDRLLTVLKGAGLEPSAAELMDMLWLALRMDRSEEQTGALQAKEHPLEPGLGGPDILGGEGHEPIPQPQHPSEAKLYQASEGDKERLGTVQGGMAFRSPGESALFEHSLHLSRALRPLKKRVPSKTQWTLDEEETARRIAEGWRFPVALQPASERWLDLVLVVEDSPSMAVWRQTVQELQTLLTWYGAFRRVVRWEMRGDKDLVFYPSTQRGNHPKSLKKINSMLDIHGRTLMLVVSDCVHPAWKEGLVAKYFDKWGRSAHVAVIQMLPERLWRRTGLRASAMAELYASCAAPKNKNLMLEPISEPLEAEERESCSAPIPVMELLHEPMLAWARMFVQGGKSNVLGAVFDIRGEQGIPSSKIAEERRQQNASSQPTAEEIVHRFRTSASRGAWELAVTFAAAPYLSLPVMRLILRNCTEGRGTMGDLAEVFLSGILVRSKGSPAGADAEWASYGFEDGVRDLLLYGARIDRTERVLRDVSSYVSGHLGYRIDFGALLAMPGGGVDNVMIPEGGREFARVSAQVVRRFGGAYVKLAEQLEVLGERVGINVSAGRSTVVRDPYAAVALKDALPRFGNIKKIGNGRVYSAWDNEFRGEVALKLMRDWGGDKNWQQSFKRAYQTLANAQSERLLNIYDFGEINLWMPEEHKEVGHFWYTMELCKASVNRVLQDLTLEQRVEIGLQVLDGIAYLHHLGLTHRGITSNHVLLMDSEQTHVKIGALDRIAMIPVVDSDIENEEMISRDPTYVAPELWLSSRKAEDERLGDQYALGVLLYELFSKGRVPLPFGTDRKGYYEAHQHGRVCALVIPERLDGRFRAVDAVIQRMLAKQPGDRYQSITECKVVLRKALVRDGLLEDKDELNHPWKKKTYKVPFLSNSRILEIHKVCLELGLAASRDVLLAATPPYVRASAEIASQPAAQLLLDLDYLNRFLPHYSRDEDIPLAIWLETAIHLYGHDPRINVLKDALAELRRALRDTELPKLKKVSHVAITLGHTEQWHMLVDECAKSNAHLVFILHAEPQLLHAFLRRFNFFSDDCPRRHRVVSIDRSNEYSMAVTALDWQRALVRASFAGSKASSLSFVLNRESARSPVLFLLTHEGGPLHSFDQAASMGLGAFFRETINGALASHGRHNTLRHPLRFIIPIKHTHPQSRSHTEALANTLARAATFQTHILPELKSPQWAEVKEFIIQSYGAHENLLVECRKIFETHSSSFLELGEALHDYLLEWEEQHF